MADVQLDATANVTAKKQTQPESEEEERGEEEPVVQKPFNSDFLQHNLLAWQPLLTPHIAIFTYLLFGVVFSALGGAILASSLAAGEIVVRYDHLVGEGEGIIVDLKIVVDMPAPNRFYYKLNNYYQNHRQYGNSRSDGQLRGAFNEPAGNCKPALTVRGKTLFPCGLMASSYFNDTFTNPEIIRKDGSRFDVQWRDDDLAFETDKNLYKEVDPLPASFTRINADGLQLPRVDQQDFIIWMKKAVFPNFKKLRFKIDDDLFAGDTFRLRVRNNYPVESFHGAKSVVLMGPTWFGVKNDFLGYLYLVVGMMCLVMAAAFFIRFHFGRQRPPGQL